MKPADFSINSRPAVILLKCSSCSQHFECFNGFKKINKYNFKMLCSKITFNVLVFIFMVKSSVISDMTGHYTLNVCLVLALSRLKAVCLELFFVEALHLKS